MYDYRFYQYVKLAGRQAGRLTYSGTHTTTYNYFLFNLKILAWSHYDQLLARLLAMYMISIMLEGMQGPGARLLVQIYSSNLINY